MTPPTPDQHYRNGFHFEDEDNDDDPDWEQHPPPGNGQRMLPPSNRLTVLRQWEPHPLSPPQVDHGLPQFTSLERSAEVFRYSFLKIEYWLSPGGALREWVRLNVRLALLLSVPTLLIAPLISVLLSQLSAWVTHLTETTSKMVLFPLSALLILGLIVALVHLGRLFHLPLMSRSRHPHRHPHSYYED
jgi:hypothetical protein